MGWLSRLLQWLVLAPLSGLYALVTMTRRALQRVAGSEAAAGEVPVVVVGNLTVGGTGKTPLVIWLAQALKARGMRVGVVSRGYGRADHARLLDVTPETSPADCGDEPVLIARATGVPVIVSSNRAAACVVLAARGVKLILSDDGLQHYRMARRAEIVVIDGLRGFGNGWLLPAGPLRETTARLRSVDAVVYNDAETQPTRAPGAISMRLRATHARNLLTGEQRPLASFATAGPVHAVAGIGNPQRFFIALRAAGLAVSEHAFGDHHPYVAEDLRFADSKAVLMTAKDAVKCQSFADERLWEVPVDAEFSAADSERLLTLVSKVLPPAQRH